MLDALDGLGFLPPKKGKETRLNNPFLFPKYEKMGRPDEYVFGFAELTDIAHVEAQVRFVDALKDSLLNTCPVNTLAATF